MAHDHSAGTSAGGGGHHHGVGQHREYTLGELVDDGVAGKRGPHLVDSGGVDEAQLARVLRQRPQNI